MYNDITGIILSGGRSSRMGENKSLMKLGGKTVIEYVYDLMKPLFGNIILSTNDPEEYSFLNIRMCEDIYPRLGPLSGIHSGLVNSSTQKNFILSCDMPLITAQMIKYLIDFKTNKPITIARADGYIQQLCGLYDKSCTESAEEILRTELSTEERNRDQKKRGCRVLTLVDKAGAEIIDAQILPFYSSGMYFNMNKREDYEFVLNRLTENTQK